MTRSEDPKSRAPAADQTVRLDPEASRRLLERRGRNGSLVVIAGTPADVGLHKAVGEKLVIGREGEDLPLRDSGVSRRHAQVSRRGDGYLLADLGSTNGTRLNGDAVQEPRPLEDGDRILVGATVLKFTFVDQTEAGYLSEIDRLVGTDDLTGLTAKHRFDAALEESVRGARFTGRALAVMMMDLDGLKQINDRHGHHAGAATIRAVGELIGRVLEGRGEACRFGGDEFAVFLTGCTLPDAMLVAGQIRTEVERTPFRPAEGLALRVTISIGVAALAPGGESAKELMHRADLALYRAKAAGRNAISD